MNWPQKVEAPPRSGRAPKNRSGLAALELSTSDVTPARTIFQRRRSLVVDPRAFQKKFVAAWQSVKAEDRPLTPPRPIAEVAAEIVIDARLRRKARQLCNRCPRTIVEVILGLAYQSGDVERAERLIDQITGIPDEVLADLGCADVAPSIIRSVGGRGEG